MPNMSYCRFRNTLEDLGLCEDGLGEISSLVQIENGDERIAAKRLIEMCKSIALKHDHLLEDET